MRLFPPVWVIGREAIRLFRVGGHDLPSGVTIFISPRVIHRDPRHYDDPEAFRPGRWLGEQHRRLPRFAYMPLGSGPRICMVQRFAMIEAVLALARILRRFHVDWAGTRPIDPQPSITLRPRGGIPVRATQRD